MKIYTKTGDDGTTGLFGGARVHKDDVRVNAYGTIDETNAVLGVVRAAKLPADIDPMVREVQTDLFALGAELACAPGKEAKLSSKLVDADAIRRLEHAIDTAEEELPKLTTFILPAGTPAAAALHHARTVCRRAERAVLAAHGNTPVRDEVLAYLNRLSDLLFVLARLANHRASVADVPWNPR